MPGNKPRDRLTLMMAGSLRDFVPDDHVLARVDRVLDLPWLREEVRDPLRRRRCRPSIDPEASPRLTDMLPGSVSD